MSSAKYFGKIFNYRRARLQDPAHYFKCINALAEYLRECIIASVKSTVDIGDMVYYLSEETVVSDDECLVNEGKEVLYDDQHLHKYK